MEWARTSAAASPVRFLVDQKSTTNKQGRGFSFRHNTDRPTSSNNAPEFENVEQGLQDLKDSWYSGDSLDLVKELLDAMRFTFPSSGAGGIIFVEKKLIPMVERREEYFIGRMTEAFRKELAQQTANSKAEAQECTLRMHQAEAELDKLRLRFNRRQLAFEQQRKELLKQLLHLRHLLSRFASAHSSESLRDDVVAFESAADDFLREMRQEAPDSTEPEDIQFLRRKAQRLEAQVEAERKAHQETLEGNKRLQSELESRREILSDMRNTKRETEKQVHDLVEKLQKQTMELEESRAAHADAAASASTLQEEVDHLQRRLKARQLVEPQPPAAPPATSSWWEEGEDWGIQARADLEHAVAQEREGKPIPLTAAGEEEELADLHDVYQSPVLYSGGEALAQVLLSKPIRKAVLSALERTSIIAQTEEMGSNEAAEAVEDLNGLFESKAPDQKVEPQEQGGTVEPVAEEDGTEEQGSGPAKNNREGEEKEEDTVSALEDDAPLEEKEEGSSEHGSTRDSPSKPPQLETKRSRLALLSVDGHQDSAGIPSPTKSASPPKEKQPPGPTTTSSSAAPTRPISSNAPSAQRRNSVKGRKQQRRSSAALPDDAKELQKRVQQLEERLKAAQAKGSAAKQAIEAEALARKELLSARRDLRSAKIEASLATDKRIETEKALRQLRMSQTQWRRKALSYEEEIKSLKRDLSSKQRRHDAALRTSRGERRSSLFSADAPQAQGAATTTAVESDSGAAASDAPVPAPTPTALRKDSAWSSDKYGDEEEEGAGGGIELMADIRPLSSHLYVPERRGSGTTGGRSSHEDSVTSKGAAATRESRRSSTSSVDFEPVPETMLKISSARVPSAAEGPQIARPRGSSHGLEEAQGQLLKRSLASPRDTRSTAGPDSDQLGTDAAPKRSKRGSIIRGRAPITGQASSAAIPENKDTRQPSGRRGNEPRVLTKAEALQAAKGPSGKRTCSASPRQRAVLDTPIGLVVGPRSRENSPTSNVASRSVSPLKSIPSTTPAVPRKWFFSSSPRGKKEKLPRVSAVKSGVIDDSALPPTPAPRRTLPPAVLQQLAAPARQGTTATGAAATAFPALHAPPGQAPHPHDAAGAAAATPRVPRAAVRAGSFSSDDEANEAWGAGREHITSPITTQGQADSFPTSGGKTTEEAVSEHRAMPYPRQPLPISASFSSRQHPNPAGPRRAHTFSARQMLLVTNTSAESAAAAATAVGPAGKTDSSALPSEENELPPLPSPRGSQRSGLQGFQGTMSRTQAARRVRSMRVASSSKKSSSEEIDALMLASSEDKKQVKCLEEEKKQLLLENARLHVLVSNLSRTEGAFPTTADGVPTYSSDTQGTHEQAAHDRLSEQRARTPPQRGPVISITLGPVGLTGHSPDDEPGVFTVWDTKEVDTDEPEVLTADEEAKVQVSAAFEASQGTASQQTAKAVQQAISVLGNELQRWRKRAYHLAQRVEALEAYVDKAWIHAPSRVLQPSHPPWTQGVQGEDKEEGGMAAGLPPLKRPTSWLQPLHTLFHAEWYRKTVRGVHGRSPAGDAVTSAVLSPAWTLESLGHAAVAFRRHTWKRDRSTWLHLARSLAMLSHLRQRFPSAEELPLKLRTLLYRKEPIAAALRRRAPPAASQSTQQRYSAEDVDVKGAGAAAGGVGPLTFNRPLALAELMALALHVRLRGGSRERTAQTPRYASREGAVPTAPLSKQPSFKQEGAKGQEGELEDGDGRAASRRVPRGSSSRNMHERPGRRLRPVSSFQEADNAAWRQARYEEHQVALVLKALRIRRERELALLRTESQRILRTLLGSVALCLSELPYPVFAMHSKPHEALTGGHGVAPMSHFSPSGLGVGDLSGLPRFSFPQHDHEYFLQEPVLMNASQAGTSQGEVEVVIDTVEAEAGIKEDEGERPAVEKEVKSGAQGKDFGKGSEQQEEEEEGKEHEGVTAGTQGALLPQQQQQQRSESAGVQRRPPLSSPTAHRKNIVMVSTTAPMRGRGRSSGDSRPSSRGISPAGSRSLGIPLSGRHSSVSPPRQLEGTTDHPAYPARINRFYDRSKHDILEPRSVDEAQSMRLGYVVPRHPQDRMHSPLRRSRGVSEEWAGTKK